jgi:hypothetical protein
MSEETRQLKPVISMAWGFIVWIIVFALNLTPLGIIPFKGFLLLFLLYWFYLKKRKIRLGYYVLGYFALAILALIVLGMAATIYLM